MMEARQLQAPLSRSAVVSSHEPESDWQALLKQFKYAQERSPYYRNKLRELGLEHWTPADFQDFQRLPLTDKTELAEHESSFLATAAEIVDSCLTSGTTGQPLRMQQTRSDLERVALNERRALSIAGVKRQDRVLLSASIDRAFMAGLAYYMGLLEIGAHTLRTGGAHPNLLASMLLRHRPQVVIGVPSQLAAAAQYLRAQGAEPSLLGLERIVAIGEPLRTSDFELNTLGQALHQSYRCALHGTYASTEMATSFTECEFGRGGHLLSELVHLELLDEEGRPVQAGQVGEVVVTPLGVTGMPLLRFRTGDLAQLHTEVCACGRTGPRLGPILARRHQLLKIRGTTVYPSAVFEAVQGLEGITACYLEVWEDSPLSDRVRLVVGTEQPHLLSGELLEDRIQAATRVRIPTEIQESRIVHQVVHQEGKRKPIHFIDHRNSEFK